MLNHIMIGTNDIDRSQKFYDAVLAVLGAGAPVRNTNETGQERLFYRHDGSTFSVSEPIDGAAATIGNGSTVGFRCTSAEQLQQFHDVAVAHGGTSIETPPSARSNGMWLAYFRDPDGNKICGVYRPAT
ncbi:VOC family protein [Acidimangrovimonas sediminis]|uniref:VOC family protein n=1 Tax=Acidimangrovimonas sediminis TaxID=2056283 RepID=UPI000C80CFD7|nr:VOC family protein [Acidimangrovimonas sediminis]